MHKKFEINRTKIKGGCQLGRKVVTHNSKSDLPLGKKKKNQNTQNSNFGLSQRNDNFSCVEAFNSVSTSLTFRVLLTTYPKLNNCHFLFWKVTFKRQKCVKLAHCVKNSITASKASMQNSVDDVLTLGRAALRRTAHISLPSGAWPLKFAIYGDWLEGRRIYVSILIFSNLPQISQFVPHYWISDALGWQ